MARSEVSRSKLTDRFNMILGHVLELLQAWTKKTISKNDWEKKLAGVKVVKEDMNRLVMNFLVTEVSRKLLFQDVLHSLHHQTSLVTGVC